MTFFKFTQEAAEKLMKINLTAAEWKVWCFLVTSVPYGDSYKKLPSTLEILSKCNVGKSTFYRAIAKLQEAEIFDFQEDGFSARNLSAVSSPRSGTTFPDLGQNSQDWENSAESGTTVPDLGQLSQDGENQAPKPAPRKEPTVPQTIKTNKTNKISSDCNEIFEEINNFSMQLARVGIYVQTYQGEKLVFNPKLKNVAVFLSETCDRSTTQLAIRQFLGWIENKRNVQDIYAMFYTSLKNFIEHSC
jgi:hypothetical protein